MIPPRNGTTPSAFENYVKAKDEISDIMDRKRRFIEYLNHRRDLLDALQRSVIESSEEALQISVEKELNKSIQQMADKTVSGEQRINVPLPLENRSGRGRIAPGLCFVVLLWCSEKGGDAMAFIDDKRIKLLYILAYLWENTDEEHSVTNTDVRTYLEQIHEISVDRRTIVSDMQLLNIFGRIADFEIEYDSSAKGYKIIQRSFEREDIQLLIDSLVNSKFIPEKKLKHLLEKLKNLISSHSWELLTIPIHYSDLQNKNKHLLYTLDSIREAIKRNKKISFYYCKNNLTSNTESTNTPYTVSPYWLRPNPDRYYLLATIDCDDGIPIWDFEVAKMSDIQILNQERTQEELVQHLNLKRQVKLRFLKEYKNKIIDTFGEENIMLIPNGDYFTASISISGESDFYDWILDQGDTVEVIGPAEIINDVKLSLRFLYKGIIIKHNKTEPTYTKTSLFLCEKRRFFMARTEKGGEVF